MVELIPDKMFVKPGLGRHLAEFDHQLPLEARKKISQGLRRAIVNKSIPGRTRLIFSLATSFKSLAMAGEYNIFHSKLSAANWKNYLPDNSHSTRPFEYS